VPPYGYGVHAAPIADLLNAYGIPARAYKGYTLEQVRAQVAADKPVIAWVIGNVIGGEPHVYTDSNGNQVTMAVYEHVVIVTGYNEDHIRYMISRKIFFYRRSAQPTLITNFQHECSIPYIICVFHKRTR
jgi:uncharacterized protein YvpB